MIMEDVRDITGYYDDAIVERQGECKTLGQIFAEWDAFDFKRWPVRNREPRTPIDSQKRAIIHERDGRICRHCGESAPGALVVDHIIPRSAFPAHLLHYADRSDNLLSSCWTCNTQRSNYEDGWNKRLGVVVKCWYCEHPEYGPDADEVEPLPYPVPYQVYCGRCGISNVPHVEGWVL